MKLKHKNDKLVDPYVTLTEEKKKAIVYASLEHIQSDGGISSRYSNNIKYRHRLIFKEYNFNN